MKRVLCCLCIAVLLHCHAAYAQTISTLAGKGTAGYSGDGGSAKDCELNSPFGIVIHGGYMYIADRYNNCIRKMGIDGSSITTFAGTGIAGYNGDNIAATAAQLNSPIGVAVDDTGSVYISDQGNNRVRMVDLSGNITTVAGIGIAGDSGDGGPATAAQLNSPRGIVLSRISGCLYIADQGNNRVRKIDHGIISNFAGSGVKGFGGDGGPATAVMLNGPYAVGFFGSSIFIGDVDNQRVRVVMNDTIVTWAGNGSIGYSGDGGPATAAQLNEPIGLIGGDAGIYIADGWNGCIRHVNRFRVINTIAGNGTLGFSGDGGPANRAQLNNPYGIARDDEGNIYIADYGNNRIRYMTRPTAVPEINKGSTRISVYPNPNSGTSTVRITSGRNEPVKLVVTNIMGQQIVSHAGITNSDIELKFDAADGIYLLTATTEHGVWHQQVLKVK